MFVHLCVCFSGEGVGVAVSTFMEGRFFDEPFVAASFGRTKATLESGISRCVKPMNYRTDRDRFFSTI